MANRTTNYGFIKPTKAESANVDIINANMESIDDILHDTQISLAPAYDQNETYNTGDKVQFELLMYKCKADGVTGAWDSTKWERTTAAEGSGGGADLDIYGEASGTAEASFSDGAEASLVECEIGIVPSQDLHGYSKPWAGGAGKNKLDLASDYTLTCYGGQTTTHTIKDGVNVKGGVEYTISCKQTTALSSVTRFTLVIMNINSTSIYEADATNPTLTPHTHSITFTPDSDQSVNFKFWSAMPSDDIVLSDFMLEVGSQATAFEPYSNICPISGHTDVTVTVASTSGGSGEDTTVSLGRTVYKGWVNLSTGEGAITGASVDLGSLTWEYGTSSGVTFFRTNGVTNIKPTPIGSVAKAMCSIFPITTTTGIINVPDMSLMVWNNGEVYIRDTDYTDAPSFKTAMSGQQLVYELATPQTFNLTKEQIQTLLGQNYVSHDGGGTISLVYIKGDAPIKPNPAGAEIPLTGLEINGEKFKIAGGEYSETSLYTYTGSTRQTTLELSDDFTEYDAIEFTFGWNLGGYDFETVNVVPSSKIVSGIFVNVGGEGRYNYISKGTSNSEIILATATGSWDGSSIIKEVRGIKY